MADASRPPSTTARGRGRARRGRRRRARPRDSVNGVRSSTSGSTRRWPRSTPSAGLAAIGSTPTEVDRRVRPSRAGPSKSTSLRAARKCVERARGLVVDLRPRRVGDRAPARAAGGSSELGCRSCRLPMPRLPSAGSVAPVAGAAPCSASSSTSRIGRLGEQVGAQVPVERRVVAAEPLERHRRVLLLLVAVVGEDGRRARRRRWPSTRWSYQSTASSSSMIDTIARWRSITVGPMTSLGSCNVSEDMWPSLLTRTGVQRGVTLVAAACVPLPP